MKEHSLDVGDLIEVKTDRLAYGGDAIARFEGLAIFIPLAAPDERLRVRITERKKNFARAVIVEVLIPSASRREAPCRYFGICGGCQLQHLTYQAQLEAKAGFVREALARIGKLDWPHEIEVRAAAEFGYRSRAQVKMERIESPSGEEIRIGFFSPSFAFGLRRGGVSDPRSGTQLGPQPAEICGKGIEGEQRERIFGTSNSRG